MPQAREEVSRDAASFAGAPSPVARVDEIDVPGAAGMLGARLYVPAGLPSPPATAPMLVYLHGGGWVVGDLDTHDQPCRFLAREAGCSCSRSTTGALPSTRSRLPVDDCLAALRFAIDEAGSLGADPARVAVGGDSAGGNLAAAVTRLCAIGAAPPPALQLLIYPVTDLSQKRESYRLFREGFFLTESNMDWYRDHYLPDESAARDPRASPMLATEIAGLPPAHVVTAGFDPLRDEGEDYAGLLRDAGVHGTARASEG